jgi:hypothetical protein
MALTQREKNLRPVIQRHAGTLNWEVSRVECRGCSYGRGRTREAALVAWCADVNRRREMGEEVAPIPEMPNRAN